MFDGGDLDVDCGDCGGDFDDVDFGVGGVLFVVGYGVFW